MFRFLFLFPIYKQCHQHETLKLLTRVTRSRVASLRSVRLVPRLRACDTGAPPTRNFNHLVSGENWWNAASSPVTNAIGGVVVLEVAGWGMGGCGGWGWGRGVEGLSRVNAAGD